MTPVSDDSIPLRDVLDALRPIVDDYMAQPEQVEWDAPWAEDGITMACTCIACPVQFEGTVDGTPAYFRERHGDWAFAVGPTPIEAAIGMPVEGVHRVWEGETEGTPSWMPHAEAKAIMRRCVSEWRKEAEAGA